MTESELTQIAQKLIKKLGVHAYNAKEKYEYYSADNSIRDFGISIPKNMRFSKPGVGWAARAVNTVSDRVIFDGFAGDRVGMNDLLKKINGARVLNKAKHDAIIAGMSTVAVVDGELVPFTALESTGEIDHTTGLLRWGLVVLDYDKKGRCCDYILFLPDETILFEDNELVRSVDNPTGRVLLHPITRRATADRPWGKSKITNTARRIIQEVGRVKRRYEIAGEFYSTPQRYLTGLAENYKQKDKEKLDSSLGKIWGFTKDEDGDKPEIGQLQQMSINQFNDNKKDLARDFCAETSLTLRNLGYETANPTSVESLTALSDDMILEAKNMQIEMGEQFKQIAITLRMSLDKTDIVSDALEELVPSWKPIFQVDLGAAGDAVYKLSQVMPEIFTTVEGYKMLGLSARESEALLAKKQQVQNQNQFMPIGGENA